MPRNIIHSILDLFLIGQRQRSSSTQGSKQDQQVEKKRNLTVRTFHLLGDEFR